MEDVQKEIFGNGRGRYICCLGFVISRNFGDIWQLEKDARLYMIGSNSLMVFAQTQRRFSHKSYNSSIIMAASKRQCLRLSTAKNSRILLMKIGALIPIRMASERLPGKALKLICDRPVCYHLLDRVVVSRHIETPKDIVIALQMTHKTICS